LARELVILPRFKRDYRSARKHPEFEAETLEYIFDVMISGAPLPEAFQEHRLDKRGPNWAGLTECHLGADLLLIYRVRREAVIFHHSGDPSPLVVRSVPILSGDHCLASR
jgi:addiction module RelE/StbE family toxin